MTKHHIFSDGHLKVHPRTKGCFEVTILLTNGFSLLSLASVTDVLGAVSLGNSKNQVRVRLLSVDGQAVQARSHGHVLPDERLDFTGSVGGNLSGSDAVVVCSGQKLNTQEGKAALKVVRWCRRASVPVCLMGAAVRVAAETGQMTKGTDHWSRIPSNSESMPHVEFSNSIFVEDGNLVTCCGELGAMDFALHWVSTCISPYIAGQIRNHLLVTSARSADRAQTCTVSDAYKGAPKPLQIAISTMLESLENLEEPLAMDNVAHNVGLSVRQIERLFSRHLSTSPVKFYRAKQFERARNLIEDTNMSVTEIALACGFSSFSAFGRGFRKQFGLSPARLRSVQQPLT
ncbi:GlxA family transcriptional regulator [Ruegeria lacuscaerulensis]|uniref:GlxA family transcriptional regulator n=1 Tax=Ruegeria lacuscaerulensis TaxID=55218 RepID=UPI00147E01CC|nr:helix-turn-helix domain-containing protein [Ruegeria lacuscaerulensis]